MIGGFVLLALVIMTIFQVEGEAAIVVLVLFGIIGTAVPVACMVAMPVVMGKPERVAMGMAVLTMISSAGYIIQPLLFGFLVDATNWVTAANAIAPICLIGIVIAMSIRIETKA
jgi:MFS family permease